MTLVRRPPASLPEVERVPATWPSGRRWQEWCPEGKFEKWFVRGTAPREVYTTSTPPLVPTATPLQTRTPLPTSTSVTGSDLSGQARATPIASPIVTQPGTQRRARHWPWVSLPSPLGREHH
jgi:hypothetical protein